MSHDLERPTPPPSRTAHVADSSAATPRRPPETRPRRIARLVIFGLAILGQSLALAGIAAIALVIAASLGATITGPVAEPLAQLAD